MIKRLSFVCIDDPNAEIKKVIAERSANSCYVEEIITGLRLPLKKFKPVNYTKKSLTCDNFLEYVIDNDGRVYGLRPGEVTKDEIHAYYHAHADYSKWKAELNNSFTSLNEKKKYKCTLMQVEKEEGYIHSGKNKTYKEMMPLIVEKTPIPYAVREIKTGMLIPVLHQTHIKPEFGSKTTKLSFLYGIKRLHTFVVYDRYFTEGKFLPDKLEGFTPASKNEIKDYLNDPYVETFTKELVTVFLAGNHNMYEKVASERVAHDEEKENARLIRFLNNKNQKKS